MEVFLLRPLQGSLGRDVVGFPLNNLFLHIEEIMYRCYCCRGQISMNGSKARLNSEHPQLFSSKELLMTKMDVAAAPTLPTACL